jgi:branched-chain amino acid transport system substrate-binding protein
MLRAAAILAVFALKKNFEFGWKPPVHILDINAVSVGTTLQPAGLEASKAVDQRQLQRGPARSELAGRPRHEEYFASCRSTMRTATKPAIEQVW